MSTRNEAVRAKQYTRIRDRGGYRLYDGRILDCNDEAICEILDPNLAGALVTLLNDTVRALRMPMKKGTS